MSRPGDHAIDLAPVLSKLRDAEGGRPVVYLSAPYTHPDKGVVIDRIYAFARVAAEIERDGRMHVASALFNHMLLAQGQTLPADYAFWQSYSRTMVGRSDAVIVIGLDGWRESVGVTDEITHARSLGKPVFALDPATGLVREIET